MNLIVVGSFAGMAQGCIPKRTPKDVDLISDCDSAVAFASKMGKIANIKETEKGAIIFTDKMPVEVELIEKHPHTQRLFDAMRGGMKKGQIYPPAEWLRFMKESHKYKKDSPHFMKTMQDIVYMRGMGVLLPKGCKDLLKEREDLTYTNKLPKLNVKKEDFFKGDQVPYKYDHDWLHTLVAIGETPAYTNYMTEGNEVLSSKGKFFNQPRTIQLLGGLEEALVLTVERSLVPNDFKPNPDRMFRYALEKVCTSITGGWFREFCWDNYFNICGLYDKLCKGHWSEKVKERLDSGDVILYNSNTTIY